MSLLTIGTVAFDTIEPPYGKAEMVIGGACTYISWAASYFTKNQSSFKTIELVQKIDRIEFTIVDSEQDA